MYNAYNYNPYMPNRYAQQPIQQPMEPIQQVQSITNNDRLIVKKVDSIEMAKNSEYYLDGSINYFATADGNAIITKQMTLDGTPKIVVFKPIEEQKEQNKYITQDDMKKALDKLDLSELEDIKDEIKDIKQELKEIKKRKKEE